MIKRARRVENRCWVVLALGQAPLWSDAEGEKIFEGFLEFRSAGTDFDVLEEYVCRVHGKRVDMYVDLAVSGVKLSLVIRIGRNDSDMMVDAGRDQLADKARLAPLLLLSHTLWCRRPEDVDFRNRDLFEFFFLGTEGE